MSYEVACGGRFLRAHQVLERQRRRELGRIQSAKANRRRRDILDPVLQAGGGDLVPVEKVFTTERLVETYQRCRRCRGQAPGVDGLTWDHLSLSDIWDLCRRVSDVVNQRTYRPREARLCQIRKQDEGKRELRLRVILDRLVATTAADVLAAYFEQLFDENSYGFRQRRNHLQLLADIDRNVRRGDYVIAQDDIRGAFDHVRVSDVLRMLEQHTIPDDWYWLIESVLRGDDGHEIGIDQGSALSPLMLNVLLDAILDKPLKQLFLGREQAATLAAPVQSDEGDRLPAALPQSHLTRYRYADNLIVQCREKTVGSSALQSIANLLHPYGMELKGLEHGFVDLREHWTELLGFRIFVKKGTLRHHLANEAWENLKGGLIEAHSKGDPHHRALDVTRGWINSVAPALGLRQEKHVSKLQHLIQVTGHHLNIPNQVLLDWMERSRERYVQLLNLEQMGSIPREGDQDQYRGEETATPSGLFADGDLPFTPTSPPDRRSNLGDQNSAATDKPHESAMEGV